MRDARMRKVVVEFDPRSFDRIGLRDTFRTVEYLEFRQVLRLDVEEGGSKIVVEDIKMKPGFRLGDMQAPEGIEVLCVLRQDGNRYTCLVRSRADALVHRLTGLDWERASNLPLLREAREVFTRSVNMVPDPPIYISEDRAVLGFLGDKKTIDMVLRLLRFFGVVKSVHFPRSGSLECDLLSSLTERQRSIVTLAQKHGYYEYPRRISTRELAERLGLKKTTLIQHLRRAEGRLMSNILVGY